MSASRRVGRRRRVALKLADYGYVLETGRITLHGPGKQLLEDDGVRRAYLGEAHAPAPAAR